MAVEQPLSQIATITMGTSPKGDTYNQNGEGLPLLNGPTEFGSVHPNCTLFTTKSVRVGQTGDLIFCVRGSTTGRMNWADRVYSLGRGVCSIRGKSNSDIRFIKYCLDWKLESLLKMAGGGTFPNLTQDTIRSFEIPFPESRRKIAAILSAYDNLIENNLRRIKILEEMEQNLYREWFVKFRFPGHQQARFVDSPLGRIPEGWTVRNIGEVTLNFDRLRKPLSSMQRAERKGIYPYYGAAKIFDFIDDYIFDGIYLLVAEDGSVVTKDRKPVLQYISGKFWPNNHTHILQGKNSVTTEFLYMVLSEVDITGYITGAAQPKITQENLNRIPIIVAEDSILQVFNEFIREVFREKIVLGEKNKVLRYTRDLLLPKLISCEVDVSELEITIPEEAV